MNAKPKPYEAELVPEAVSKIKALNPRAAVTGRDVQKEVKRASDLAKSAGTEPDLPLALGAS